MFEFLFKYSPAVFSKGKLVLLAPWPAWVLVALILATAGGLFWHIRRHKAGLAGLRFGTIWIGQTLLAAIVLFMLWHPVMSVARLRPQQNVVAVMLDQSRSMSLVEDGKSRIQKAEDLLAKDLLPELSKKFQVRLYGFGHDAARVEDAKSLAADEGATRIGDSLKHIAAEAGTMPLGAVIMLTDGGDNTGGVDRDTIAQLKALRLPVHSVGFGPEHFAKDIEISGAALPSRVLANSRVNARISFRQRGYDGQKVKLTVRENGHPLAMQEITLRSDAEQNEAVLFNAGPAGAHSFEIGIEPQTGEQSAKNNTVVRLVNVTAKKMRILLVEGELVYQYKFLRRAMEDDQSIEIVGLVRTTQNKTLQQGGTKELGGAFPDKPEELFAYDGLIIGSEEASYFTPAQQQMIRDFADKRGGGVMFTAGRFALSDGGYANTPMAEMMPLRLLPGKSFTRNYADVSLTGAGAESPILRLEDTRDANLARWKKMPKIATYAGMGAAKPGAVVLMEVSEAGRKASPLLAIENFGLGRTAVFATSGDWLWQMLQDHKDMTHEVFWQQLLRWLVTETPGQVTSSTPHQVLSDETEVPLRAVVRDKNYDLVAGALVDASITRPDGKVETMELKPDPLEPGTYTGKYSADRAGVYVTEVVAHQDKTEFGRDALTFRREDGVAENFGAAQNKDLLQKLATDTGGAYYTPDNASRLGDEVAISEAGISGHDNLDIWDMPILFLMLLLIRGAEWLLRRKWGVV